jgi:hypothetical protein
VFRESESERARERERDLDTVLGFAAVSTEVFNLLHHFIAYRHTLDTR